MYHLAKKKKEGEGTREELQNIKKKIKKFGV